MLRMSILIPGVLLACALPAQQPSHVPCEAFTVPDGLEVTLWAKSPLLHNPTNMDVDHEGRVWVAEGVNYRGKRKRRPAGDRIVVLEDTNRDGKADKSTVFVQEPLLVSPLGIAVFGDKVVVAQPPHMLVYTDVDRNQKFDAAIDKREIWLTGFQGRNHDHSLHSVTSGPGGRWYWNSGNCGAVFTDESEQTFRITSSYMDPQGVAGRKSDDGHVYVGGFTARMEPDGSSVEIIGHNYRNSYEQVVTSFGDVFQSDNDDPPACRVSHVILHGNAGFSSRDGKRSWRADRRRGQDVPTAEWRQDDPGTMPAGDVYGGGSPTGVAFYENGALDKKWQGLLLCCEPGRNTVFGYLPKRVGAGFEFERMDWMTSNPQHQFVGSDFTGGRWDGKLHTQFRPSDVTVGPDGAIYVADWFDGRVGGHQTLDDSQSGAIYRVAPKGFVSDVPEIVLFENDLTDDTPETEYGEVSAICESIVTALASPANNVRYLGWLAIRAGYPANPLMLMDVDPTDPYLEARAYWVLASGGEQGAYMVKTGALRSDRPETRAMALRALARVGVPASDLAEEACEDASPFVRAALAPMLRDVPAEDCLDALIKIGQLFDGKDRSYLEAFGIGCTGKESEVYSALAKDAGDPIKWSPAMAWIAWRLGAPESVPALVARVRAETLTMEQRQRALTAIAFVRDERAMAAMVAIAEDPDCALSSDAMLWCIRRMGNEWRPFGLAKILRERELYDPDDVQVQTVRTPPAPEQAQAQAQALAVADVVALPGVAERGPAKLATCYACHQVAGRGVAFGPDLVSFANAQSVEAVAEAILQPSKSISHGYAGHTVVTADGSIDGIVLSRGDPVIVQSQGGLLQMIPKQRVQKIRRMKRSLMWPSQLYSLGAQDVADLIAFLKSQR